MIKGGGRDLRAPSSRKRVASVDVLQAVEVKRKDGDGHRRHDRGMRRYRTDLEIQVANEWMVDVR